MCAFGFSMGSGAPEHVWSTTCNFPVLCNETRGTFHKVRRKGVGGVGPLDQDQKGVLQWDWVVPWCFLMFSLCHALKLHEFALSWLFNPFDCFIHYHHQSLFHACFHPVNISPLPCFCSRNLQPSPLCHTTHNRRSWTWVLGPQLAMHVSIAFKKCIAVGNENMKFQDCKEYPTASNVAKYCPESSISSY